MPDEEFRAWLLHRVEAEGSAVHKSDRVMHDVQLGHVMGYVDVGVFLGYWSADAAARLAQAIETRQVRKVITTLG
jgi:hypothetical protein